MSAPATMPPGSDHSGEGGGEERWDWFAGAPKSRPAGSGGRGREDGGPPPARPAGVIRPVGTEASRRASADGAAAETRTRSGSLAADEEHGRSAPHPSGTDGGGLPDEQTASGHSPAGHAADAGAGPAADGPPASPDAIIIHRTLAELEPVADKFASYFYALLFIRNPEARSLFPPAMNMQRDRFLKALLSTAQRVDDPEGLTEYLSHLARGHRKYGTVAAHYPAVGECLLDALARYAAGIWNEETEGAWVRAYTAISQTMIDAAAADEQLGPAWWQAEVVAHELRTRDIAVITVRPDQPYPFRAGQYASIETPWWPRVWRHYSFASAPRADGLLVFHVKAVPAGWVSNALVHRARPGDVIRLGPSTGSMTVDHSADNGLLCLGGGTGIAPIKALVEDVIHHGGSRPVDLFYGARTGHDLYDIEAVRAMARAHRWLSFHPVVSAGGGPPDGLSGQLPDVVRHRGPWAGYDAYLSGPADMVRSGVDALTGLGIPPRRIRHDAIEELTAAGY